MSTIKPPIAPSVPTSPPTETQIKPEAQPSSPPIQSTPLDGIDSRPQTNAQTTETPSRADGLQRPTPKENAIPTIQITAAPDPVVNGLDIFASSSESVSSDPNRLAVPIDDRLSEAKANLSNILEALGKHPQLKDDYLRISDALEKLEIKEAEHQHRSASAQNGPTSENVNLSRAEARIQSETEEIESEIAILSEELEILSDPVKHERLSSRAQALLRKLPSMPALDSEFRQAYAGFVQDFGEESAAKHQLGQNHQVLQHNANVLQKNGEHLEAQRDHLKDLLSKPLTRQDIARVERHFEDLVKRFDKHQESIRGFNESARGFVDFIDSLRDNKQAAQQERAYVTATKAEMLQDLDSVLETEFNGGDLQNAFAQTESKVGRHLLDQRGFTANLEILQHNLGNVQNSLHSIRSYAQMLKSDIEKADHRGWVDARKENINELKSQLADYQTLKEQYANDLKGFISELNKLEASASNAPASEKRDALQNSLSRLPKPMTSPDLLLSHAAAIGAADKGIQTEAARLEAEHKTLESSFDLLKTRFTALEGKVANATTEADFKSLRDEINTLDSLLNRHNSDVRSYQRLSDRLITKLPGTSTGRPQPKSLPLTDNGKLLLDRVARGPSPLFDTMKLTGLSYSDGRSISFSTQDRISVWNNLIEKSPSLDLNQQNGSGNTLLHQIILSAGISETEKSEMVEFLASKGADLNTHSRDGLPPIELALRLSVQQPELVDTLRDNGAKLSLNERIPVLAHLIGAGGEVSLNSNNKIERVALEGLSPTYASYGLDPAFVDSLDELQGRTGDPLREVYQRAERGWVNTMSYDKFIGRVRDAKIGEDTRDGVPEVLSTGWDHPSGHAISFVFNHEPDGYYFYACNTGDVKDPERSIVKYEVADFNAFLRFLKTASHNGDHTRSLYVDSPEPFGLKRVAEEDQLPTAIDKSSQKIGNCTVASRKAALLAMMWSENRDFNIPPQELKAGYKAVTTELRERGIRGAIESGHQELMGKALVKMLTKFDREPCRGYAFELASAMIRKADGLDPVPPGGHPGEVPESKSQEFEAALLKAIKIGNLNLKQREANGLSLTDYARSQGNLEAAAIMERLSQKL